MTDTEKARALAGAHIGAVRRTRNALLAEIADANSTRATVHPQTLDLADYLADVEAAAAAEYTRLCAAVDAEQRQRAGI